MEGQGELDALDTSNMDESEVNKYKAAQNKVARRIRDLETIKVAISQFFVSINQTFEVQVQLNQAIDSIRTVGPIVLQNAIMIHSAINAQKQSAQAVKETSEAIGNALEQNADMVKENAENVADLYNNPVIALDKLESSYAKLEEAVNTTRKAREESTVKAREMTQRLVEMNRSFQPVVDEVEGKMKGERDSLIEKDKKEIVTGVSDDTKDFSSSSIGTSSNKGSDSSSGISSPDGSSSSGSSGE